MIGFVRSLYTDPDCQKQLALLKSKDCLVILQGSFTPHDSQFNSLDIARSLLPKEVLIVSHLAVLGGSLQEVMENLTILHTRQISVITIREQLNLDPFTNELFIEFLTIMENFQKDVHSEHTRRGLEEAKIKGKKSGRPKKNEALIEEALMLYHSKKLSYEEIQERTGIGRSTLYRYLNQS